MMHQYTQLLLALALFSINTLVSAEQNTGCPRAEARTANGEIFVFREHQFESGAHDLVISRLDQSDIKRVTYSGKATLEQPGTCIYKALAIAQGGDWGWHLAWTFNEKAGVFYSRMDGVAWVSTPPKRIGEGTADALNFELKNEQVTLFGYASQTSQSAIFSFTSDDEGRNW